VPSPPVAVSAVAYTVSTVPAGSDVVVTDNSGNTSIESGLVAVWPSPLVAFTVNSLVPVEVGVPEIVEPTSVSPAGNVPALIDHE
jgi:hypothetical protein